MPSLDYVESATIYSRFRRKQGSSLWAKNWGCKVSLVLDRVESTGRTVSWMLRLPCPWDSPGNNTGVACRALFQGVFPIHRSRLLGLLRWQASSLALELPGKHWKGERELLLSPSDHHSELTYLTCRHMVSSGELEDTRVERSYLLEYSLFCWCTFISVQSLSHVRLFATPWTAACQASLSITNSRSSPKPMSIESVIPSNHLILCRPFSSCPCTLSKHRPTPSLPPEHPWCSEQSSTLEARGLRLSPECGWNSLGIRHFLS